MKNHACLTLLVWTCLSLLTSAHVVQQFFAEIKRNGPDWQVEVLFDAGYADPVGRGDPFAPQPTRDWLVAQNPGAQQQLCRESALYLDECLDFSNQERPIEVSYHFLDFEKSPPDFPKLLTNGAYLRIQITPKEPESTL